MIIKASNFILCYRGADAYGFVHRTFLEYFCAVEIVNRFEKQQILSFEQLQDEVFGLHWQDETWHEVLRLICGMIDIKFSGQLIEFLMEQQDPSKTHKKVFLAADCLVDIKEKSKLKAKRKLVQILKDFIVQGSDFDLQKARWYYSNRVQIKGIYVRVVERDRESLDDEIDRAEVRVKAVMMLSLLEQSNEDYYLWLLELFQGNYTVDVKQIALHELTHNWKSFITLSWLKQIALQHKSEFIRQKAVEEIAYGWNNEPSILSWFKHYVEQERFLWANWTAVHQVSIGWKDDPRTLIWLKNCLQQNENQTLKQAAMQELARRWSHDSETLPSLKKCAQMTEMPDLQQAALQELVRGWKENDDTLSLLKVCAQSDDCNFGVRSEAITELTKGWIEEPWIFDFLCDRTINDPFIRKHESNRNPRLRALNSLLDNFPTHPKTIELLRDRAANDPDEQLRKWAQKQLVIFNMGES